MNPLIVDNYIHNSNSPIIVGLDFNNEAQVMDLVKRLDPNLCKLKIGKELFTSLGPKIVEKLAVSGFDVFLDLKFHDIPNTVYKACIAAANLGVWMLNVHASGGSEMLDAARKAINDSAHKPLLIGVTILTSMDQHNLHQIGITDSLNNQIIRLAKLCHNAKLDGVVCSAMEAKQIKDATASEFLTITPGIRLTNDKTDDQTRIMTPVAAINNMADYLVIGRPITQAVNPHEVLLDILTDIHTSKIS